MGCKAAKGGRRGTISHLRLSFPPLHVYLSLFLVRFLPFVLWKLTKTFISLGFSSYPCSISVTGLNTKAWSSGMDNLSRGCQILQGSWHTGQRFRNIISSSNARFTHTHRIKVQNETAVSLRVFESWERGSKGKGWIRKQWRAWKGLYASTSCYFCPVLHK